jgi:hypothetical protein
LGQHFGRLANELGDGVVNRQKVQGSIRCAQVEYSSETVDFITKQLQVQSVPTMQLYQGTNKIWQVSGKSDTQGLKKQLAGLEDMSTQELRIHAESLDDGILEEAIQDTMYDQPDFLNEEW